jgi:fructose/tagatose bisphosphate aldolase
MQINQITNFQSLLEDSVQIDDYQVNITDKERLKTSIHRLAEVSALESGSRKGYARYLTRKIALALGILPSSIQDLYLARGRGDVPSNFTVPAINLRALSFDAARAVFRAAKPINAGAIIFEIARSEMGYTSQPPTEYATNILAAAIAEGYSGPVFIQGDHFQVSAKRYASDPGKEIQAVKDIIREAIAAGFYNIDVDTSTLVDLNKATVPEQQFLNTTLSAMFTSYIRDHEPEGITISVGGEIGEVGGHNSTEEELHAYMNGFNEELTSLNSDVAGISKISIQTGTSHGGVVLPDGSIAQVSVDFDTMLRLSRIAREKYGMAGAVQHGASTLPEDAFGKFVEAEACEVHLATNFQNMLFDHLPEDLRDEMYAYLDQNHADERKPGMTDDQFYYKTRKRAVGPFKAQTWNLPPQTKSEISADWENQFSKLFNLLGVKDTVQYINQTIKPVHIEPDIDFYLGVRTADEDVSDLAD